MSGQQVRANSGWWLSDQQHAALAHAFGIWSQARNAQETRTDARQRAFDLWAHAQEAFYNARAELDACLCDLQDAEEDAMASGRETVAKTVDFLLVLETFHVTEAQARANGYDIWTDEDDE